MSGFNRIVESIFQGYKESKTVVNRQHERKFDELGYTPFLFSDKYLKELYLELESTEDYERLIDYMDRFDLYGNGYRFCDQLYIHTKDDYEKLKKKKSKNDDWLNWV
ncbi:hypothetical protein [Bacillus weihaiensis]|uniref:hypothetical protein n=1 Tax=Bacillus weihaiensis TaxID=1547283 RepID=UPI0023566E4C|nr:hypothetical protein [Bacillus weihaiensis]